MDLVFVFKNGPKVPRDLKQHVATKVSEKYPHSFPKRAHHQRRELRKPSANFFLYAHVLSFVWNGACWMERVCEGLLRGAWDIGEDMRGAPGACEIFLGRPSGRNDSFG